LERAQHYWTPPRWAVIKDARRRQRRRQRRILTIAAVLLAAGTVGWAIARSVVPGHAASSSPTAGGTIAHVVLGGVVQSTTTLRGDLWVLTCRRHCADPWSRAVRGQLVELTAVGRPIKRIAVADPGAVAGGDGSIWVAHFYSGQVTRIDPHTGRPTASLQLKLPGPLATTGDRRFIPSAISFSADRVWVSTARGWTAEINPHTARLMRMAFSSSEAPSATTAGGLTWVADELDGIGTFPATSTRVTRHQISWAGQPLDVDTVAYGAGLIWALGAETNDTISLTHPPTTSVVTTINPYTGRILHQWRVANNTTMVIADGGAYVGDDRDGRLFHLTPPNHVQILRGPKDASLTSATPHALWATAPAGPAPPLGPATRTLLLRIELPPH
jgi:streptogramin lyase